MANPATNIPVFSSPGAPSSTPAGNTVTPTIFVPPGEKGPIIGVGPETLSLPMHNVLGSGTTGTYEVGGYGSNNVILAGYNNKIKRSRRCSILQGTGNTIDGLYNTHIIGDFVSPTLHNAFFVGCPNGLHVKGDVVAFFSSDKRLKDNISIIIDPLEKILKLDAVEFDWNNKQEVYQGHDIGLIAQQVEEVAPELVTTRDNGYKAVKYEKLTALLVGAIKEQQKQIEFLEKRVASLERRSRN
tara:strand:- start:2416 stop:3141 length:726 start_codon:yes stop_codon:yes gene_type:complete